MLESDMASEEVEAMRKALRGIPLALIVVCVVVAPAAAKARTVKQTYTFNPAAGGSVWVSDETIAFASAESITFETTRADRKVSLTIADDTAGSVSAAVRQGEGPVTVFCNEIESVPITGGTPVEVRIILELNPAANGCATPDMPTTGTVTATFEGAAKKMKGHHHH
jgi:hypothetical protein